MMIRNLFLASFSFLCIAFFSGQDFSQKSIDSLWSIVKDKNAYVEKGSKEMLRLCTEIYYQSKNAGYDKGGLRAIVKMTEIYANEQNYTESLKKIHEGLALAEKNENYTSWSDLLFLQGIIYTELGYYKKSKNTFSKALVIADKISDDDEKHICKRNVYTRMANNLDKENKYDSVRYYFQKAYDESVKLSDAFAKKKIFVSESVLNLASVCLLTDNIPKAEKYLDEFEILMKGEKNKTNFIIYYRFRGDIENKKKNYTKAIGYYNNVIQYYKEYGLLISELTNSYSGIAESYEKLGDYKNQSYYLTKAKKISDSISFAEKKTVEQIPSQSADNTKPINIFVIIIGVILLAIFTGLFIYKKKNTQELIPDTITNVPSPEEKRINNPELLNNIIELAKKNDRSFHLKFSELFPTFNQKLLEVNPQLTHSDLEYCALIKLKFDTKEIALYKKTSIVSVESKKYRIRKKLNIGTDENIYTWLMNV
ncbi:hypothetical protein ACFO4P_03075 [Epilithonimonas pallida]|uniref:Tetratricopeptide repeat protein n=1 Tax=Epilithonimonas pallida TaxID=373671 RepID=A0ABY1R3K7_9FLAO|nr:tetratricopeptide repeat protein [Epilithonimonas pallida]SMP91276.1 hypothetical protein SAMN05421679_1031 [Epilithonimonas pallida]